MRDYPLEWQDRFWRYTVSEFNAIVEGYRKQRRRRLEETAHFVRVIIGSIPMRGKNAKTPTVNQIIGMSEEELAELEAKRRKAAQDAKRRARKAKEKREGKQP